MKLEQAEKIARALIESMRPFCERLEIAGSIRRKKPEVKDIEIVAVPIWKQVAAQGSLFDQLADTQNLLYSWAHEYRDNIRWIKPGATAVQDWTIRPGGKYWRALLTLRDGTHPDDGIKLDLFLCGLENFGLIYAIRTGCAEFSQALVTRAKAIGLPSIDGFLTRDGEKIQTPEEIDVFKALGVRRVKPEERVCVRALRLE